MQQGNKCDLPGCLKQARWQIAFRIWPIGVSKTGLVKPVEGLTSTCVCDEHAIRDTAKFFTPVAKEHLALGFLEAGRGMPDFATAEIIHTAIDSDDPITKDEAMRLGGVMSED